MGIIVALPVYAVIADELGWEMVFYISGSMGVAIVLLWTVLVFSFPSTHPRITEVNNYIYFFLRQKTLAAKWKSK